MGNESSVQVDEFRRNSQHSPRSFDATKAKLTKPVKTRKSKPTKPLKLTKGEASATPTPQKAPGTFPPDKNVLVLDAGTKEANGVYIPWSADTTGRPRWRHQEDMDHSPENTRQISWSPVGNSGIWYIWGSDESCLYQHDNLKTWVASTGRTPVPLVQPTDIPLHDTVNSADRPEAILQKLEARSHLKRGVTAFRSDPAARPNKVDIQAAGGNPDEPLTWSPELVRGEAPWSPVHGKQRILNTSALDTNTKDNQTPQKKPGGNWFGRAKDVEINGNHISALLLDSNGDWVQSEIDFHSNSNLTNIGGSFVDLNKPNSASAQVHKYRKHLRVKVYSTSADRWYVDGLVTDCDHEDVTVDYNRINTFLLAENGIVSTKTLDVDSEDIAPLGEMVLYTPNGDISVEMKTALLDIFCQYKKPKTNQMGWTEWETYWKKTYGEEDVSTLLNITEGMLGKRTSTAAEFLQFYTEIAYKREDVCIDDLATHGFPFVTKNRAEFEFKQTQTSRPRNVAEATQSHWECYSCGEPNKATRQKCNQCNKPRNQARPKPRKPEAKSKPKKTLSDAIMKKDISDWTCPDVASFLFSLGDEPKWKEYAAMACTETIDGATIEDCDAEDLVEIGFEQEHAERVVAGLEEVKEAANQEVPTEESVPLQAAISPAPQVIPALPVKVKESLESQRKKIEQEILLETERVSTSRDVLLIDHNKYNEKLKQTFVQTSGAISATFDEAIKSLQDAKRGMLTQFAEFQATQMNTLAERGKIVTASFDALTVANTRGFQHISDKLSEINASPNHNLHDIMRSEANRMKNGREALKNDFYAPKDVDEANLKESLAQLNSLLTEAVGALEESMYKSSVFKSSGAAASIFSAFAAATKSSFSKGANNQPPTVTLTAGDATVTVNVSIWKAPGSMVDESREKVTATLEEAVTKRNVTKERDGAGQIDFDGLTNGVSYRVIVASTSRNDGRRLEAAPSEYVTPRGVPDKPTLQVKTRGLDSVVLQITTGSDNGAPITSVTVALSNGKKVTCPPTETIRFDGLETGTDYSAAAVAFNEAGMSAQSDKLHLQLGWPAGVQSNFPVDKLKSVSKKYEGNYSDVTRGFDLESLIKSGTDPWVFVGAREKGKDKFYVGAFGRASKVLRQTTSSSKAQENNGVYWYWRSRNCFGFADSASVKLSSGSDRNEPSSEKRLSWRMNTGKGGLRAGKHTRLEKSQRWLKCFYVLS